MSAVCSYLSGMLAAFSAAETSKGFLINSRCFFIFHVRVEVEEDTAAGGLVEEGRRLGLDLDLELDLDRDLDVERLLLRERDRLKIIKMGVFASLKNFHLLMVGLSTYYDFVVVPKK